MITIKPFKKRKKSPVYISEAGSAQKYDYIRLQEDVTLVPKEIFKIETNLQVECTEDCDECWVHGGIDSDDKVEDFPHLSSTERFTLGSENKEIIILGYNGADETITLPKGTDIARVFYSCMEHNERVYDATKEFSTNVIYKDDVVAIFSMDNKAKNVDFVVNPDTNEHFWKITETNNE